MAGGAIRMGIRGRSWWLALVVVLSSLMGGWLGPSFAAATADGQDLDQSVKTFTKVYDLVESNFADQVSPDKAIYDGAIPGMLRTLDPHSNFFDPKEVQLFREGQKGQYFGVGMLVGYRNNRVTVMHPFLGSPAKRAGLRPGDAIVAVNGKNTEKLGTSEVVDMLKGPRGTAVTVAVKREGVENPIKFDLIREEVNRPSVTNGIWVKKGIGYVKVSQFNENTSRELESELKGLGEENVEGLVLDLRGNPGGILGEAVAICERYLEKGQSIVSQRGRIQSERAYTAKRGNAGRKYPIVVLVDRFSASASEIVSGALQDHDRAWILGEATFGKGLVQAPYPLSEDCQLLLTIARYYTPSGRLIQRDYSKGSFFEYYSKKGDAAAKNTDVKATDSGRVVYGGGGITPDEKWEKPVLNKFQAMMLGKGAFFYFAAKHFGPVEPSLPKNWEPDEPVMQEFRGFLKDRGIAFTEGDFTENLKWVKEQLRVEMYTQAFGNEEAEKLAVRLDPEVEKAIDSMSKARALMERAKKMMASRVR